MRAMLLSAPIWLSTLAVCGFAVTVSSLGLLAARRYLPHDRLKPNNEVAGFIYGVLGLIYGVVLAFVVIKVFEDFNRVEQSVDIEAGQLADLYHFTASYEDPKSRQELRGLLINYAEDVLQKEWPVMARGKVHLETAHTMRMIWRKFLAYRPHDANERVVHAAVLKNLEDLADARRLRLLNARASVHGFMWFVLISGAIVTVGFSYLLAAPNVRAHGLMIAMLAFMIATPLLLIAQMDQPFLGQIVVSSEAIQQVYDRMRSGINN